MTPPAANARLAGALMGGRYRVGKLLGEGGMGAVYEASPIDRPDVRIALKVLHDEMSSNPNVVERFLAEGDVCRRLDHPGILRVHDIGQERGVPYLVMELLQGRALIDYTEAGQKLPINFAVTVCAGVLHALDYAHAQGIVHRDLKPENVFLVPGPDGQYHTKLLDFGIAKCIDAAGGARKMTATGVLLGTPGYMSPEQVKGARTVDHRADLWAVGVMFYEMVTGKNAFPSDGDDPNNIWGLISAVLTKDPLPLSRHDPQLVTFDPFILKALAKDMNARYPTAREMSDDLLRTARGEIPRASVSAPPQPINSQGQLVAIPSLQPRPPPTPRSIQITPVSGGSQIADVSGAGATMPTGGDRHSPLAGTMPITEAQRQQFAPYAAARSSAESGIAATALAPQGMAYPMAQAMGGQVMQQASMPQPMPNNAPFQAPYAQALAPVAPRHGTSPSGFAPQPMPPNESAAGPNVLVWIALGVFLVAALGGALFWALGSS